MSGLSSRVMTMKFMQKANMANENMEEEEKKLKIKDLSEWVHPNSSHVLKRALKKSNVIQSVGYGSINQLDLVLAAEDDDDEAQAHVVTIGRKKWGEAAKVEETQVKEESSVRDTKASEPESSGGSLDSLWKTTQKLKSASDKRKMPKKRSAPENSEYTPDIPHRKKRFAGPGA